MYKYDKIQKYIRNKTFKIKNVHLNFFLSCWSLSCFFYFYIIWFLSNKALYSRLADGITNKPIYSFYLKPSSEMFTSVDSIIHSPHFPSPITKSKHDNMCSVCVTCKKLQRQRARNKSVSDRQGRGPISFGIPGSNRINTNTAANHKRREA